MTYTEFASKEIHKCLTKKYCYNYYLSKVNLKSIIFPIYLFKPPAPFCKNSLMNKTVFFNIYTVCNTIEVYIYPIVKSSKQLE